GCRDLNLKEAAIEPPLARLARLQLSLTRIHPAIVKLDHGAGMTDPAVTCCVVLRGIAIGAIGRVGVSSVVSGPVARAAGMVAGPGVVGVWSPTGRGRSDRRSRARCSDTRAD